LVNANSCDGGKPKFDLLSIAISGLGITSCYIEKSPDRTNIPPSPLSSTFYGDWKLCHHVVFGSQKNQIPYDACRRFIYASDRLLPKYAGEAHEVIELKKSEGESFAYFGGTQAKDQDERNHFWIEHSKILKRLSSTAITANDRAEAQKWYECDLHGKC